jgi:hypothetical protein
LDLRYIDGIDSLNHPSLYSIGQWYELLINSTIYGWCGTEGHYRERGDNYEYDHEHRRHKKERDLGSESDTTPDDDDVGKSLPKSIDSRKPSRISFDQPRQSSLKTSSDGNLKEDPERPGTYTGYVRNPPRKESRP